MEITIYELLGLIKGGKAPKKIKYVYEFSLNKDNNVYECEDGTFGSIWKIDEILNHRVKIIEEEKEIEKINYYPKGKNEFQVDYYENGELKHFCLNKKQRYFADKINEIIDEINKLKKEGK